ncbi:MAG: Tim44 domain-containing protein [Alphaproteobacteria bacterium]|nr:Tim44 domain-containing protein [Alphaproteobacteria bacterium]
MAPDLIIYAIVAAGLVFWLRSVLGTRHGEERERPPLMARETADVQGKNFTADEEAPITAQDRIIELAANPTKTFAVENKTAENGLIEISKADKNFDVNFFLEAAQDVFVMVVEAFAKGERETLKDLLNESVYKTFEQAIAERESRGEAMSAEIIAMRKTEITGAQQQGKMAYITVRFRAEEITVTRGKDGEVVSGHPERVNHLRDIWTFGRDIKSRDPRWLVYETREDEDGDHDIVPVSN